jgi:plasmid stabilization system protein ParE
MGRKKEGIEATYQVRISENAIQNLDEITDYIAIEKQAPLNAIKVGDRILIMIERIALRPFSFKECNSLKTKSKIYRQVRCMSWYIIYRVIDTHITILGIIHTSRKPGNFKILKKVE